MESSRRTSILGRLLEWLLSLFRSSNDSGTADQPPINNVGPSLDIEAERTRAQVQILREAFGSQIAIAHTTPGDDATAQYVYRSGHLLVAPENLDSLRAYFASRQDTYDGVGELTGEDSGGPVLYSLPPHRDGTARTDPDLFEDLEEAIGAGGFSPDHLIYVTYVPLCPATEPENPDRDLPWPREARDTDRGAGVMINVVDTGWWKPASQDPEAPWLAHGVDGDAEQINPAAIHPYGGHGTFVAGVIRCRAPQAQVHVDGMLTKGGAIFESELMRQLDIAVLSGDAPNIVSISGGTHTYNDQPLKTFEHLARKHNLIDNPMAPLIVAAAGNDSTDAPFWPAAFDWVVGVGSLDRDDTVSDYSNYGDWVDIYAIGRDHVNAFPTGTYTCYEPPNVGQVRHFKNLAKWSGTSFSTPLITGLIAGLMTEHGLTSHEAWLRLRADGIVRTDPNVGKILTVDTPGD